MNTFKAPALRLDTVSMIFWTSIDFSVILIMIWKDWLNNKMQRGMKVRKYDKNTKKNILATTDRWYEGDLIRRTQENIFISIIIIDSN